MWGARHPQDIPGGRVQQSACVEALAPEVRAGDRPRGSEAASLTPVVGTDDGDRPTLFAPRFRAALP